MRLLMPTLALLLAVSLHGGAPAHAQTPEDQAEAVRLSEDMKRLSRRNAWRGVDEAYNKLMELADREVKVGYDDHVMGADAATQLGDISAAYKRLKRANAFRSTDEVKARLDAIEANFGEVSLSIEAKYAGETTLTVGEMPFAADQRNAITQAQGAVANRRPYDGLLPYGSYTMGPKSFVVEKGKSPVNVALTYADGEQRQKGMAFVGPRVDIGPAFTSAGSPSSNEAASPGAFSGPGARVAVGVQVGMHSGWGALVQVGYQGMFGGTPEAQPGADTTSTSLHLGYGWLAGVYRLGSLDLALGPTFGMGTATATNSAASGETGDLQAFKGSPVTAGGSLGVSYVFLDFGSLALGGGLQGGMMFDDTRSYSYGQLGLTLAPVRRDG